jgi:hypothetical protein
MESSRTDPDDDALFARLSRPRLSPRVLVALLLALAAGTGTAVAVAHLSDSAGFGEGY